LYYYYNLIRHTKLTCSEWISVDETMCAWRPRTTVLGGLPNISIIVRKSEPLCKLMEAILIFFNYSPYKLILFHSTYFQSHRSRIQNNGMLCDRCDAPHGNPARERRHKECL